MRPARTPIPAPAMPEVLDAVVVLAEARADAAADCPAALSLVRVLDLCFDGDGRDMGDDWPLIELRGVCESLLEERAGRRAEGVAPCAWPLPAEVLYRILFGYLGRALNELYSQGARPKAIYAALRYGNEWLTAAARLAVRDGHKMAKPGGMKLPEAVAGWRGDGGGVVAELLPADPTRPDAPDTVLRLTWADTARLVIQSLPGRARDRTGWEMPDSSVAPD